MSLIKDSGIYFLVNLITKTSSFLVIPLYTTLLSPDDFGIKSAMATFASIVLIINTLAAEKSIYRLYWDYPLPEDQKKFLGTAFFSILGSSILTGITIFLFSTSVSQIFKSIPFYPFFALVTLKIFVQSFFHVPKIHLQVTGKVKEYSLLNLLEIFADIVGGLTFIYIFNNGVTGYLQGSLAASLLISPIYIFSTLKIISFTFNKEIFKKIFHYSVPMVPSGLSAWVLNLSDRIFVERFTDVKELGVYSLGYQLGGAVLVISSAFFIAYYPYYFKKANSEDQVEAKGELAKINNMALFVFVVVSSLVCLFSKDIIYLFFSEKYSRAAEILVIISISNIFSQGVGFLNLAFHQSKKTKQLLYVILVSSLVNVMLNIYLIPLLGINGAALATLLSFVVMFFLEYVVSKKYYFIPFDWKMFVGALVFCTLPMVLMSSLQVTNIWISLATKLLLTSAICIVIYLKTDMRKLWELRKQKS